MRTRRPLEAPIPAAWAPSAPRAPVQQGLRRSQARRLSQRRPVERKRPWWATNRLKRTRQRSPTSEAPPPRGRRALASRCPGRTETLRSPTPHTDDRPRVATVRTGHVDASRRVTPPRGASIHRGLGRSECRPYPSSSSVFVRRRMRHLKRPRLIVEPSSCRGN